MKPTRRKKQTLHVTARPKAFQCVVDEFHSYGSSSVLNAINGPQKPSIILTQWVMKRNSGKRLRFGCQVRSASTGERVDVKALPANFLPVQVVRRARPLGLGKRGVLVTTQMVRDIMEREGV